MGMLALTRRVGEEVVIGDPSNPLGVVRVVDIHGDKVRLAFDFPRDLQVNRRELADQKARETTPPTPPTSPPATPPTSKPDTAADSSESKSSE